jgi:PhoH-like ATPase
LENTLKTYVVDTNVIMQDPYFYLKFPKNSVIIPTIVLQELDKHKKDRTDVGKNVREFSRIMDKNPDLFLYFDDGSNPKNNDDLIISAARKNESVLISNDMYAKASARSHGVEVLSYNEKTHDISDTYKGVLDLRDLDSEKIDRDLYPNEYVISRSGLYRMKDGKECRVGKDKQVFGITHKNVEQKCAIDALLDDSIKLVTITGKAGSGKTLLALACALEKVAGESKYQRINIARPVVPMGNDIGYLPGEINDKLGPWMQPIFDNLEFLCASNQNAQDVYRELENDGIIKIEPLTYIRGRSIPNQFIILDEAQNTTIHEIKTILTRVGENTKIIVTGDPDQIDNPKLDSTNNGLSYIIEKFKDQKIAAHIHLSKCERSELAEIASEIL